ncbi:RipA family octameric membrane protein [Microbulbifer agarilyticus]|uniref:RipA family octameric membrane protein n=1 Tax=Microbulbifer agarilyticus TaxID=260552 RepID=UPI001CD2FD65|nr:hypothetical protein [Microbulbifer agarilyticus]MCA0894596.1 hypothetical protein [Microbulbifer agarilyticus]
MSSTKRISKKDYKKKFDGKESLALNQALDIRKFEIDLYWRRATYFWTFIGATLAGFIAIEASEAQNKQDLAVILANLGLVFSFAWFCANKGSKFWQENWEKHVDVLEDNVTGPLYKVVLSRNEVLSKKERVVEFATGPAKISVSKINQLISLYVTILWTFLLIYSLPEFSCEKSINWFYVFITGLSALLCASFLWLAGSYGGGYHHTANLRKSRVKYR